jgi:hypothetical protein
LIFSSDDKNVSWDGNTSDGKLAADGVYYYVLEAGSKSYNGTVTLIR